jgi:hypothetical protein
MVAIELTGLAPPYSKVRFRLGDIDTLSTRAGSFVAVFECRAGDRCVGGSAVVDSSLLQLDGVALRHYGSGADDSYRQTHRHDGAAL